MSGTVKVSNILLNGTSAIGAPGGLVATDINNTIGSALAAPGQTVGEAVALAAGAIPSAKINAPNGVLGLDANGTASGALVTPTGGTRASLEHLLSGTAPVPGFQVSGAGGSLSFSAPPTAGNVAITAGGEATAILYSAPLHYFNGKLDIAGSANIAISTAVANAETVLGLYQSVTNTATGFAGVGSRIDFHTYNLSGGFDDAIVGYVYPHGYSTTVGSTPQVFYAYIETPYDTTNTARAGIVAAEYNVINAGQDLGWTNIARDQRYWMGGHLITGEIANGFGDAPAGIGSDILFGYAVFGSADVSTTLGRSVKMHNGFIVQPDALTGAGRAFCASGDTTTTPENFPYAVMQAINTFQYGNRFDTANITTNVAMALASTQTIVWADAPSNNSTLGTVLATLSQSAGGLILAGATTAELTLQGDGGNLVFLTPSAAGSVTIVATGSATGITYEGGVHYFSGGSVDAAGGLNVSGGKLTIATGEALQLGNTAVIETITSTKTVTVLDSTGATIKLLAA